jgi:hypothetical protein
MSDVDCIVAQKAKPPAEPGANMRFGDEETDRNNERPDTID